MVYHGLSVCFMLKACNQYEIVDQLVKHPKRDFSRFIPRIQSRLDCNRLLLIVVDAANISGDLIFLSKNSHTSMVANQ
jgi:uncharacterized protein (UPF0248 family)